MVIQELSQQESLDLLACTHLARLGRAHGAQPYVVPVYFEYHEHSLYSFTTVGRKIEVDAREPSRLASRRTRVVSPQQWMSVVVFGRYEELPDTPQWQSARALAHELLKQTGIWWEPGYVRTILHEAVRPLVPVFYRIRVMQITGHRATPEPMAPPDPRVAMPHPDKSGWLPKAAQAVVAGSLSRGPHGRRGSGGVLAGGRRCRVACSYA